MQYFLWGVKMKKKWNYGEKLIHVKSVEDLNKVREIDQELYKRVFLILDKDLHFGLNKFEPIDASNMDVIIRGNNHMMTDIYVKKENEMEVGLFSKTKNFQIFDVSCLTGFVKGGSCVGTLVGSVDGDALVSNVKYNGFAYGESHCGTLFGTTKRLTICSSDILGRVGARDVVGGAVGMCDEVKLVDSTVLPLFDEVEGKIKGKVAGFVSKDREKETLRMLAATLPYLEPKPTIEEEYIFGLRR